MSPSNKPTALLLGMVYAHQATEPKRGQEFRDRVRCEALQNIGYQIFTLDDKHDDRMIEEHCRANFADTRRMMTDMANKWGEDVTFDHIILDYFFSPAGWARQRWNSKFFSTTLPQLVRNGHLSSGGKIWLPHLHCITERLSEFEAQLLPYFEVKLVRDSKQNPLYLATENVERELLTCPDALTNETQLRPLLEVSDHPFYVLQVRDDCPTSTSVSTAITSSAAAKMWKKTMQGNIARSPLGKRARTRPTTEKRGYVSDTSESEPPTPVKRARATVRAH